MRCGIAGVAGALFAISLLFPVSGRLVGRRHSEAGSIESHISLAPSKEQSSGCPTDCSCEPGDVSNGGVAIANGMCYDFCSSPLENVDSNTLVRYCGKGADYKHGDSLDCRKCIEPQFFDATSRLHEPEGKATRSIILLGPWNASLGRSYTLGTLKAASWGMNSMWNYSAHIDSGIKERSRVVDVVGRPVTWPGYGSVTAWYGYPDYDAWNKNVPVLQEVDHAIAYVHHLIEQEHKIVGDYSRISLVGLHTGGNIAIESALRFPKPLGLVVSQRGIVLPSRMGSKEKVAATPYVLTAGGSDNIYPESLVRESFESLRAMNVPVFMKTMPEFDHYRWSKEESVLTLKSCLVALSEAPASEKTLAKLTDWTVAS